MSTVEQAIIALDDRWGEKDRDFGASLARAVRSGKKLSDRQRRAAWKMVQRYEVECEEPRESPSTIEWLGKYVIRGPYDPMVVSAIKDDNIPYNQRVWTGNEWVVDDSPAAQYIIGLLIRDFFYEPTKDVMQRLSSDVRAMIKDDEQVREMVELSSAHDAPLSLPPGFPPLYPYQRAGVLYGLKAKRYILADDMGLGKTLTCLTLAELEDAYPLIVVTTASGKGTWREEVAKWFPHRRSLVLDGGAEDQVSLRGYDVYIVNYSILPDVYKKSKKVKEVLREGWVHHLSKLQAKMVVFDEGHRVSNSESLQAKAAKTLVHDVPYRVIATGTPNRNGRHAEFLSLLNILDQLEYFGGVDKFLDRFCDRRLVTRGANTYWDTSGASHDRELNKLLAGHCMVRHLKLGPNGVAQQLPPKVFTHVPMELSNRKEYEKAHHDYLLKMVTGGLEQHEHLTHIAEMRRLCIEGKMPSIINWIEEFLDVDRGRIPKHGEKLVVFVYHRWTAQQLADHFHVEPLIGGMSAERRDTLRYQFQTDPSCRLFVANIEAAGEAITLTAASNVAFCEQAWTPTAMDQAIDRCHRIGTTADSVNVWQLYADNTIDDDMAILLAAKEERVERVADAAANVQRQLIDVMQRQAREIAEELGL